MDWKWTDAESRLSELVTKASTEGPQTIHRHDATVVVIAEEMYRALTGTRPDFNDWLLNGPRLDDLELPKRSQSTMRPVNL